MTDVLWIALAALVMSQSVTVVRLRAEREHSRWERSGPSPVPHRVGGSGSSVADIEKRPVREAQLRNRRDAVRLDPTDCPGRVRGWQA